MGAPEAPPPQPAEG